MMARLTSLPEAVAELVCDGDCVALEGFTHLIPFAAGHEIIRQGRRDLTLVRLTPDLVYDQMIGMGCARRLVFSWGGNPGVGSLHRFRDAVENGWPGPLELEEHSHAGMANRYVAGAAGDLGHRRHDPRGQHDPAGAQLEVVHHLLHGDEGAGGGEYGFLLDARDAPDLDVAVPVRLLSVDHGHVGAEGGDGGQLLAGERAPDPRVLHQPGAGVAPQDAEREP